MDKQGIMFQTGQSLYFGLLKYEVAKNFREIF